MQVFQPKSVDEINELIVYLGHCHDASIKQICFLKDRELTSLRVDKERLQRDLKFAEQTPAVSNHALVRYMERHMGFDIIGCKKSLLTDFVESAINSGANKVKIEGIDFVVKDKVIVTTF